MGELALAVSYTGGLTKPSVTESGFIVYVNAEGNSFTYGHPGLGYPRPEEPTYLIPFAPYYRASDTLSATDTLVLDLTQHTAAEGEMQRVAVQVIGKQNGGDNVELILETTVFVHNNGGTATVLLPIPSVVFQPTTGDVFSLAYSIVNNQLRITLTQDSGANDFDCIVRALVQTENGWA